MCIVHVSLVPILGSVGEQKTKPTQHSVAVLRSLGLHPNLLACRCSEPLDDGVRQKLVGGGDGGECPVLCARTERQGDTPMPLPADAPPSAPHSPNPLPAGPSPRRPCSARCRQRAC
jgi:hypothetical protein